jgi:antibiotic biosynthesis monooxygenase (ABM) superfamily enzyme
MDSSRSENDPSFSSSSSSSSSYLSSSSDHESYTLLFRFDTLANLVRWMESDEREEALLEVQGMLEIGDVAVASQARVLPDAFTDLLVDQGTPAPRRPPPKWKVALLTSLGLFCVAWPFQIHVRQGGSSNTSSSGSSGSGGSGAGGDGSGGSGLSGGGGSGGSASGGGWDPSVWGGTIATSPALQALVTAGVCTLVNAYCCAPLATALFGHWLRLPRGRLRSEPWRSLDEGPRGSISRVLVCALYVAVCVIAWKFS